MVNIEETKRQLNLIRYKKYIADLAQDELRIIMLDYQLLTFQPSDYSKTRVQGGFICSSVENVVCKLESMQEDYSKKWEEAYKEIQKIEDALKRLSEDDERIIKEYYIKRKTMRRIGEEMHYDHSVIVRKLHKAVRNLSAVL